VEVVKTALSRLQVWGKRAAVLVTLALPIVLAAGPACAAGTVFLDERFESLDRWLPLTFPKITRHSTYSVARCETGTCLLMESDNSASGLVLKQSFNVYAYPTLTWRWKVSTVYRKGDSSTKEGDDYPARLYVMFAYDPVRAPLGKQLKYRIAKTIYGQYPPDSSISYIWDNRATGKPFVVNAYADEARMIPVSAGPDQVNTWQEYTVDIVRDYQRTFGQDPPATASLAVMSDADNTHESARAWIQYIRLEGPR
jgi:hypothetical protein